MAFPDRVPIVEDEPQRPINPYGFTKLVIEEALADYAQAYGLGYAALRYFNAAGASPEGDIGEDHTPESHLIPLVLQVALGQREKITIFGDDYPTPDGTCIRDYVHVDDLGAAHLRALELIQPGQGIELNLGTGRGYSVREVIDACRKISGHPIPAVISANAVPAILLNLSPTPAEHIRYSTGNPNTQRSTRSSKPLGAGTKVIRTGMGIELHGRSQLRRVPHSKA